jgi:hypothetical protein
MSPGRLDDAVVRRHLFSIDDAVRNLRRHQGKAADLLASSRDELWSVERGLQLCAQNVLNFFGGHAALEATLRSLLRRPLREPSASSCGQQLACVY